MKLFVGLGNPGADYAGHRHNIGFMALDPLRRRMALARGSAPSRGWCPRGGWGRKRSCC